MARLYLSPPARERKLMNKRLLGFAFAAVIGFSAPSAKADVSIAISLQQDGGAITTFNSPSNAFSINQGFGVFSVIQAGGSAVPAAGFPSFFGSNTLEIISASQAAGHTLVVTVTAQ